MKQMDENLAELKNQVVRVDSVILPPWAKSNHHFIYLNYMALERSCARENIHHWIDLMFGYKQQKGGECFNLFKPLTSEKYIRQREETVNDKLDIGEISHIAEFGHHPVQIFDKPHELFDPKVYENGPILSDIIFQETNRNVVYSLLHQESDKSPIVRTLPGKDKRIIITINSSHILLRKQIIKDNSKTKPLTKPVELPHIFPLLHSTKSVFTQNPLNVFAVGFDRLVLCRTLNNAFTIYNLSTLSKISSVMFHQTIVTTAYICEKGKVLLTGDMDGVVALWKFDDSAAPKFTSPIEYFNDHGQAVIGLEVNYDLDLFVSSSSKKCVFRILSTKKHFITVRPTLKLYNIVHEVFTVLLSSRGYLVVHSRSTLGSYYNKDLIEVYSINGEKVAQKAMDEHINALLLDETGYFLVTGGTLGKIEVHELVTMDPIKCGKVVEGRFSFPAPIMSLTLLEGGKAIMVGLANNSFGILQCTTN